MDLRKIPQVRLVVEDPAVSEYHKCVQLYTGGVPHLIMEALDNQRSEILGDFLTDDLGIEFERGAKPHVEVPLSGEEYNVAGLGFVLANGAFFTESGRERVFDGGSESYGMNIDGHHLKKIMPFLPVGMHVGIRKSYEDSSPKLLGIGGGPLKILSLGEIQASFDDLNKLSDNREYAVNIWTRHGFSTQPRINKLEIISRLAGTFMQGFNNVNQIIVSNSSLPKEFLESGGEYSGGGGI